MLFSMSRSVTFQDEVGICKGSGNLRHQCDMLVDSFLMFVQRLSLFPNIMQGRRQLLTTWGGGLICETHSIRSNTAGGLGGSVSPPVGPGQSPDGDPGEKAHRSSEESTIYTTWSSKKSTLVWHFFYVLHLKDTGKNHQNSEQSPNIFKPMHFKMNYIVDYCTMLVDSSPPPPPVFYEIIKKIDNSSLN